MQHHLVIGAGPVGSGIARLLAEQGSPVTVLTRRGTGPQHRLITAVAADATDVAALAYHAAGAAAIYNCANPAYHRWATDWPPIHKALMATAQQCDAVLVMMDNLYAFGPTAPMPLHENDALLAAGTKGATRAAMARQLLQAHADGLLRGTLARASDFFGPEVTVNCAFGDRVVPRVLAGKSVSLLGRLDVPHSLSYMPDVVRTMVTIGTDPRAWGKPWHVPNAPAVTQREVVGALAAAAGTSVKVRAIGRSAIAAAGLFAPKMRELKETYYQFDKPWITESALTEATFGLAATPLNEAAAATVAWWRSKGVAQ